MSDHGEPTDADEEPRGDQPPPDPDAPARGVLEDEADPPEPNEPA